MSPKPVSWDGHIRWAIKGCSVFDDQKDEAGALLYPQNFLSRQPLSSRWVFQYGLRYIPTIDEANAYRTVRIEKLPEDISLDQVLSVTPGEVYSSRLFDTTAITGYNTVIVVFLFEHDARSLVQSASGGLRVGSSSAKVTLVGTPTYPMPPEMDQLIQRGHTRCLVVSNMSDSNQADLAQVLQRSAYRSYVERIEEGPSERDVSIRFHCIKSASAACSLLQGHPIFRKCHVSFLKKSHGELVLKQV